MYVRMLNFQIHFVLSFSNKSLFESSHSTLPSYSVSFPISVAFPSCALIMHNTTIHGCNDMNYLILSNSFDMNTNIQKKTFHFF